MSARARGVWVVLLGPDGSGKSAVIERLERDLGDRFGAVRRFHLRPRFGLGSPDGPPVRHPHALPPRGFVASLAKLGLWWVDCVIGYLIAVRPALRRQGLVVFDRYVDDLVVDPRRYRYGGSPSLARFVARWTPRPHVLVILDAPESVLRERKREVERAETARQREAYRDLAVARPNAVVVDAARPLDEVVGDVEGIVLRARNGGKHP